MSDCRHGLPKDFSSRSKISGVKSAKMKASFLYICVTQITSDSLTDSACKENVVKKHLNVLKARLRNVFLIHMFISVSDMY